MEPISLWLEMKYYDAVPIFWSKPCKNLSVPPMVQTVLELWDLLVAVVAVHQVGGLEVDPPVGRIFTRLFTLGIGAF
jgi:hypothetical protein